MYTTAYSPVQHNHNTHNHSTNNTSSSGSSAASTFTNSLSQVSTGFGSNMVFMLILSLLIQLIQQIVGQSGNEGENDGGHNCGCSANNNNGGNTGTANNGSNTGTTNNGGNTGVTNNGGNTGTTNNGGNTGVANNGSHNCDTGSAGNGGGNGNVGNTGNGGSNGNVGNTGNNPAPQGPVTIDSGAKTWGDPHFVGAEGGKYDVQGEVGKTYNILSDKDFQMNAEFRDYNGNGSTVMGKIGLTIGNDQVAFTEQGELTINGQKQEGDGSFLNGAVVREGKNLKVNSGEYNLKLESGKSDGFTVDYGSNGNVAADGVMPHGLWGQSADGDGKARNGDKGHGAQGGGAIEDVNGNITEKGDKEAVKSYEVAGLFDTGFANHNRFHS